jgi:hypothetical protein
VNLLRKTSVVIAGLALAWAAASPAEARGRAPDYYAWSILWDYGDTWAMHEAGCVTWNYRQQSWYTHCGLPQYAHPRALRVRY